MNEYAEYLIGWPECHREVSCNLVSIMVFSFLLFAATGVLYLFGLTYYIMSQASATSRTMLLLAVAFIIVIAQDAGIRSILLEFVFITPNLLVFWIAAVMDIIGVSLASDGSKAFAMTVGIGIVILFWRSMHNRLRLSVA